tara:strand:+ start:455 stop:703 length:249 start_codon:yes stop_codon:yes gene_type:complete
MVEYLHTKYGNQSLNREKHMAEQKTKTALAVEKSREVSDAIRAGHAFWKDHPGMPKQSTYDLALSIVVKLKEAGYTIVRKKS